MNYSTTAIRRWNGAPLDPSPPPFVRSEVNPMPMYYEDDDNDTRNPINQETTRNDAHITDFSQRTMATGLSTTSFEVHQQDNDDDSIDSKKKKNHNLASVSMKKAGDDTNANSHVQEGSRGRGWGRGIKMDVQNTIAKYWKSEMTNLNQKTIAVSFFLFFACISPAITFGAVYGKGE